MVSNPFTTHPRTTGESYGQHFAVAIGVSRQLAGAAIAAFVHALIPKYQETTASEKIRALNFCLEVGDRDGLRHTAHLTPADPT